MALTKEVILANEKLKALNEEQIGIIVGMSLTDENDIIGRHTGKIHGDYERDFLEVSGIAKNQGEKAYEYGKRVIKMLKDKAEGLTTLEAQIQKLTTEKADLEKQVKDGKGNEHLTKQLNDITNELNLQKKKYDDDKSAWDKERETLNSTIDTNFKKGEIQKALSGFKFKSDIQENIVKIVVSDAERKFMEENVIDSIDDGKGGKVIVLRDKEGNIRRNPANQLHPFTISEVMTTYLKDIIDTSEAGGAGSKGGPKTKINISNLNIAKTQIEANDIIDTHLLGLGLKRTDEEFENQKAELWKANNCTALPEK